MWSSTTRTLRAGPHANDDVHHPSAKIPMTRAVFYLDESLSRVLLIASYDDACWRLRTSLTLTQSAKCVLNLIMILNPSPNPHLSLNLSPCFSPFSSCSFDEFCRACGPSCSYHDPFCSSPTRVFLMYSRLTALNACANLCVFLWKLPLPHPLGQHDCARVRVYLHVDSRCFYSLRFLQL